MFTAIFLLVCIPWISCESGISPTESDTLDLEFLHWKLDVERKSYHETLVLSVDSLNIEDNTSNQDQGEHQNSSIIRPDCLAFLHEFSSQAAGFIKCCINNARPFRFCEGCVTLYTKAVNIYNDIVRNDETLDNCQKILLMSDRVQVINNVKMSIDRIWKDADCANCFKYYTEDVNGTVHAALTDNTLEFLQMYNNFSNCVDIHTTNLSYNATVCKDCLQYYQAMNNKFDDLLNDPVTPRHVCMDMVDMMNYTRLTWGEQLNCTVVHKEYAYVVIVVVVLLGLPVLFYTILSVIGKKKQQMLVKQKRLSPFHHNSYGTLDSPTYHSVDGAGLDGGSSIRRNLSYTSGAQGDNSYNTRTSSQNT